MFYRREIQRLTAVVLAVLTACPPARALISLNEGRERIFVGASVSVSRDSNIFANSDHTGDFVYSTSLSADYTRRVGWIGVNANASVGSSRFATVRGQDFNNPSFGLEFTKQTGRTTGSITLSASRESRADASVNLRSTSWNIPVGLNFKYPISGVYTLTGGFNYSSRRYLDETVFSSLASFGTSLDLLKILTNERELITGYRYRFSESSRNTSSTDHAFSLGLSGKLLRGMKGSLRVGYQTRGTSGRVGGDTKFDSWFASGSSSYSFSRKLVMNGTISKDYSTTATDSIVDTTNASLTLQYAYTSRWNFSLGGDFGDSKYLGEGGRILLDPGPPPLLGKNRHDNFLSWDATGSYAMNEHLKMALSYSWFRNWSTVAFADFVRSSWTFTASTRW
jgi:hypothetical protein